MIEEHIVVLGHHVACGDDTAACSQVVKGGKLIHLVEAGIEHADQHALALGLHGMQEVPVQHLDLAERTTIILRLAATRADGRRCCELVRCKPRAGMTDGSTQRVHEGQCLDGFQGRQIGGADGNGVEPLAPVHQLHVTNGQHGCNVSGVYRQVQLIDRNTLGQPALDGTGR